jgi:type IV secretory pathway component VirB8
MAGRYANKLGFAYAPGGIPMLPLDEGKVLFYDIIIYCLLSVIIIIIIIIITPPWNHDDNVVHLFSHTHFANGNK